MLNNTHIITNTAANNIISILIPASHMVLYGAIVSASSVKAVVQQKNTESTTTVSTATIAINILSSIFNQYNPTSLKLLNE
jgi:hypothetical protein